MLRTKVVKKCILNMVSKAKKYYLTTVSFIFQLTQTDTFYSLLLLTIHVSKDSKESNSYFRALL